jgi:hypothetical protein
MARFEILEFTNEKGEKDFSILDRIIRTEHPTVWGLDGVIEAFEEKFEKGNLTFLNSDNF